MNVLSGFTVHNAKLHSDIEWWCVLDVKAGELFDVKFRSQEAAEKEAKERAQAAIHWDHEFIVLRCVAAFRTVTAPVRSAADYPPLPAPVAAE